MSAHCSPCSPSQSSPRRSSRGAAAGKITAGRLPCRAPTRRCMPPWSGFREGLRELGYVEGHNIAFDCRSPDGARAVRALAPSWSRPVDVIVTDGATATPAAKARRRPSRSFWRQRRSRGRGAGGQPRASGRAMSRLPSPRSRRQAAHFSRRRFRRHPGRRPLDRRLRGAAQPRRRRRRPVAARALAFAAGARSDGLDAAFGPLPRAVLTRCSC